MLRLALLLAALASPAFSQERQPTPIPIREAKTWAAVGRVTRGADAASTCTGVLIAPARVLTVAHCVGDLVTPEALAASDLTFRAGAHGATDVDRAKVVRVETHPSRDPAAFNLDTIPNDLAVLTLERPLTVDPLPFGDHPSPDEPLVIISYRNVDLTHPYLLDRCRLQQRLPRLALIGCGVVGGNSGSPLLARRNDRFEITGLISAQSGRAASYAILITTWPVDAIASE